MVCVQKSPRSTSTSTSSTSRQKRTIRKTEMATGKEFSGLRAVVPLASSCDLETVLAAIQYIHHLQSQLTGGQ